MKFYCVSLVFGAIDTAVSFSYLESLKTVAPPITKQIIESPFFFVDVVEPGSNDLPAPDLPAPYQEEPQAASAPETGFSYQEESPSFTSAGTKSYMEALSGSPTSTSPSGAGITSYLDAIPQNTVASVSGAGVASYAESLNNAGALSADYSTQATPPPALPATPAAPAVPVSPPAVPVVEAASTTPQSFSFENDPVTVVASSANYMDALSSSSSTTAPSGGGMRGYLDALPSTPSELGGAGITGYLDALPTVGGTSGGVVQTYSTSITGVEGNAGTQSFTMGSINGKFDFKIDATDEIIDQILNAGDRKVTLNGKITDVLTME